MTIKSSADSIDDFSEGLSEEEERLLAEQSAAASPPPASSEGEDPDKQPEVQTEAPAGQTTEPGQQPVNDVNAEADQEAKESFEQFAAKHKDRSPEDLLKLAFQKEQARKAARFDAKEARDVVTGLRDGMQRRLSESQQRREQEKQRFNQTLAEDPDKAAQMAFEAVQTKEAEEEQAREWNTYVASQTEISRNIIPNFDQVGGELMSFGVERMGYDPAQVAAAHDARDIVTLYYASRFDKLVQAGVVDMEGRLVNPAAVQQTAPTNAAPARSVPARTPPLTMSSAPGNGGGGSRSLKDQAAELLTMSEADFEKAVESGLFDQTLHGLSGAGR